jgi:hypothetical protein
LKAVSGLLNGIGVSQHFHTRFLPQSGKEAEDAKISFGFHLCALCSFAANTLAGAA